MPDEVMLYCRRCDLAFCEQHAHHHQTFEAPPSKHPHLKPRPDVLFCSVCVGIYQPSLRRTISGTTIT